MLTMENTTAAASESKQIDISVVSANGTTMNEVYVRGTVCTVQCIHMATILKQQTAVYRNGEN